LFTNFPEDRFDGNSDAGQVAPDLIIFFAASLSEQGGRTMGKTIKNIIFTAMAAGVLCAGTVSAHQLSLNVQTTTCRGFCTKSTGCPNILGCACVFNNPGATVGICNFIAARPG
jgi:hypothetical protein